MGALREGLTERHAKRRSCAHEEGPHNVSPHPTQEIAVRSAHIRILRLRGGRPRVWKRSVTVRRAAEAAGHVGAVGARVGASSRASGSRGDGGDRRSLPLHDPPVRFGRNSQVSPRSCVLRKMCFNSVSSKKLRFNASWLVLTSFISFSSFSKHA